MKTLYREIVKFVILNEVKKACCLLPDVVSESLFLKKMVRFFVCLRQAHNDIRTGFLKNRMKNEKQYSHAVIPAQAGIHNLSPYLQGQASGFLLPGLLPNKRLLRRPDKSGLLAMTESAFPRHCEACRLGRGNLNPVKCSLATDHSAGMTPASRVFP